MNDKFFKKALLVFAGLLIFSFAILSSASDDKKNIFNDKDQDGLSDEEEKNYGTDPEKKDTDGDSYSDGAEILSGYDPLKPSPGDKIETDDKDDSEAKSTNSEDEAAIEKGSANLTQELSAKLAGLLSGEGATSGVSISDLDSMIQETIGGTLSFEDLPEIDEKDIKIKEQSYGKYSDEKRAELERRDTTEYLTALSYIAISNSPKKIASEEDITAFGNEFMQQTALLSDSMSNISYFKDLAEKGAAATEQMKDIEVPENMLATHKKGLQLFKYAISLKDKFDSINDDPVNAIAELSNVQGLLSLSLDFAKEIDGKFKEVGINESPMN